MLRPQFFDQFIESIDSCPWGAGAGRANVAPASRRQSARPFLYTAEERRRRDETRWTLVQGVLAPVQFLVFLVSLFLVLRYLATGDGVDAAMQSVVVKTAFLYAIMITGAIWEHEVFGRYLFAPAFYWEDMFSMLVIALHTAYVVAMMTGALGSTQLMVLALAAYAAYVVNATQFILKLRAARLEQGRSPHPHGLHAYKAMGYSK